MIIYLLHVNLVNLFYFLLSPLLVTISIQNVSFQLLYFFEMVRFWGVVCKSVNVIPMGFDEKFDEMSEIFS